MKSFNTSKENEYRHLRNGVGLSNWQHLSKIEITGADALDIVNRLVLSDASRIPIGRLTSTYLLNSNGTVFADAYVCNQGDRYLLISEGPTPVEVFQHVQNHGNLSHPGDAVDVTDQKALFGVDGPFSWELLKQLVGVKILGLRYLETMPGQTIAGAPVEVLRAGKTGEFGYLLLCPAAASDAVWQALQAAGTAFGAAECGFEAINLCRLENRFVNLVSEASKAANVLELNCRIMIVRDKDDYTGKEAVEGALANGIQRRLIGLCLDQQGETAIEPGAAVEYQGNKIGQVATSGYSFVLGRQIAVALLDTAYAYVGLAYQIQTANGLQTAQTVSAPFVFNNSLKIRPQEDSFFTVDWSYGLKAVAA
jgi:aminomethyltransferase